MNGRENIFSPCPTGGKWALGRWREEEEEQEGVGEQEEEQERGFICHQKRTEAIANRGEASSAIETAYALAGAISASPPPQPDVTRTLGCKGGGGSNGASERRWRRRGKAVTCNQRHGAR
jgi:hypothetical protein